MDSITRRMSRPARIGALPEGLRVHWNNAKRLLCSAWVCAPFINDALEAYEREVGLLRLVNFEDGFETLPSISLIVSISNGRVEHSWEITATDGVFGCQLPKLSMSMIVDRECARLIICDLWPLVAGATPLPSDGYTVYAHAINVNEALQIYAGVTKRSWETRLNEHLASASSGSDYLFHKALREQAGVLGTAVAYVGDAYVDAMNMEEWIVEKVGLYPKGFNMIPGGFAGLRYLAQRGFQCGKQRWEHRQTVIERFAEHCQRTKQPNPLSAMHWRDDDYASRVICNNPRNFSREQVGMVRLLDSFGKGVEEIAAHVGCNERRVVSLLSGATYSRVAH